MDAAMDSFDDADDSSMGDEGRGERGEGRGGLDEEGMLEEGVDLRLMGQLVPRFLGKVCMWGFVCVDVWMCATCACGRWRSHTPQQQQPRTPTQTSNQRTDTPPPIHMTTARRGPLRDPRPPQAHQPGRHLRT